jgi:single-stranded-DNA-specific exonuclease
MDEEVLPKPLFLRLSQAVEELSKHSEVRVLTHYDADGLSAAGILANVLVRANKRFHLTMVKSLEDQTITEVAEGAKCLILADMGSSSLPALEATGASVIVLDHHAPIGDSEKLVHVNPHLFGIDGMTSGCAGAVAMMFAVTVSESNWDLLPIAFGGIVGDRQHIRGLSGINLHLLNEGLKRKLLVVRPGSLLPEGVLLDSLIESTDPYMLGVTGEPELLEAGVPIDANLESLDENQRRRLSSLVALHLLKQGCTTSAMEELITDRYFFPSWRYYGEDMAQLLNACGRTDQESIGVALTLGDKAALQKAEGLRGEYKRQIVEGMASVVKAGISKMTNLQYFYSTNPSLSGVLGGLTMQFVGDCDKPTIVLSRHPEKTRVSSRATFRILEKGVDMAAAMRQASALVGGIGGGHAVAAGATVPKGKEEEFLDSLDKIVGEQKAKKTAAV